MRSTDQQATTKRLCCRCHKEEDAGLGNGLCDRCDHLVADAREAADEDREGDDDE